MTKSRWSNLFILRNRFYIINKTKRIALNNVNNCLSNSQVKQNNFIYSWNKRIFKQGKSVKNVLFILIVV